MSTHFDCTLSLIDSLKSLRIIYAHIVLPRENCLQCSLFGICIEISLLLSYSCGFVLQLLSTCKDVLVDAIVVNHVIDCPATITVLCVYD